jgi:hypothetical protein
LFQPDERVEAEVRVLCPPARFTSLTGEAHELPRHLLVQFIEHAQVTDVTEAGAARGRLQSADLGRRAEQFGSYLFYGQAAFVAQSS